MTHESACWSTALFTHGQIERVVVCRNVCYWAGNHNGLRWIFCYSQNFNTRGETLLATDWILIFTMFIAYKVFCKIIINSKYTASDFGNNPETKVTEGFNFYWYKTYPHSQHYCYCILKLLKDSVRFNKWYHVLMRIGIIVKTC